jgi:LysR family hydrogen peroxide-inducible transcriptional activator
MKIQQLKYVLALDEHRHFMKAAEACEVTQSTLSAMIQKLEEELEIQIFDRKSHPIKPTLLGESIIAQAREVVTRVKYMKESIQQERTNDFGTVKMGIIPTVVPYILPHFLKEMNLTKIDLRVHEMTTENVIKQLRKGEIDCALLATPLEEEDILEIPIYYERFLCYLSPNHRLYSFSHIEADQLPKQPLWLLEEGHCFRSQILNFCERKEEKKILYEAASIDTLIRIVDVDGGMTVIPELHFELLSEDQQQHVREIVRSTPVREISMVVRNDFVRERVLNIMVDAIKSFLPSHMLNERLKKFAVKL